MLMAGTLCPLLAWRCTSQKHEITSNTAFPHFIRLKMLPRLFGLSAAELGIKPPETLEVTSPSTAAPTQKQSQSLQLLSAFPSNAEQLLWETTNTMNSQGLA